MTWHSHNGYHNSRTYAADEAAAGGWRHFSKRLLRKLRRLASSPGETRILMSREARGFTILGGNDNHTVRAANSVWPRESRAPTRSRRDRPEQ
jgi:hypothetical protein